MGAALLVACMEQDEAAVEAVRRQGVRSLVESLRAGECEPSADAVRLIFRYEGDDRDVVHVRDDVDEAYTDPELEQRIETLAMKGLGDPPRQGALHEFGELRATVRWFDEAVCVYAPDDEWAGVMVVLDRTDLSTVESVLEYVED